MPIARCGALDVEHGGQTCAEPYLAGRAVIAENYAAYVAEYGEPA